MLLKVKYQGTKKYIRLQSGFTYLEFINEGEQPSCVTIYCRLYKKPTIRQGKAVFFCVVGMNSLLDMDH